MVKNLNWWEINFILNSIYNGIIAIDNRGYINIFNNAAEKILKIKREDALNKHVTQVVPNTRLHIILETKKPEIDRQQIINDTTIVTNRFPVMDEHGKIIGAVAVFRDISEIKNLANEITNLKDIQSLLKAIINSTQDAISVVDDKGNGILFNPAYTKLTGLTEKDVIGKPATVDIAEGESMHLRVLKTKKPVKNVPMKVGPNKREVVVNVAPITVNGKLKGSVAVIHDVSEIKRLNEELDRAKKLIRRLEAKYNFQDIIGNSRKIKKVIEQAKKAANTPATVLLRGESGTGKELFAHAIHNESERKYNQFIRVNCSAISDSLLESELFGYGEGAFTGAKKGGKKGLFEEANKGTIFLDEIGEISEKIQTKLLRVLQEKEIVRVGETKVRTVDARVIAATNKNLEKAVKENKFRKDLYYRLNVFPIYIPPLRERKEDIPLLVKFLIKKFNQEYGRSVEEISEEGLKYLMKYDWPGNVRELENVISRAMINMKFNENIIEKHHLPVLESKLIKDKFQSDVDIAVDNKEGLNKILDEYEKKVIMETLKKVDGNRDKAAKLLKISLRNLYYKLKKHKIN